MLAAAALTSLTIAAVPPGPAARAGEAAGWFAAVPPGPAACAGEQAASFAAVPPEPAARAGEAAASSVIGRSVQGRAIRVTRVGDADARVNVLVVGDVHGNEPAGEAIVARLRRARPDGFALYLVRTANPDGRAAGTRQNARGVDLNRNFPWRWRPGARGTYFPGRRAGSEPETRAIMRLVRRIRPRLALYYHQHMGITVRARGADPRLQRAYARRTGLPLRSLPNYRGTAVGWENRHVAGGSAFVVELHAGRAPAARHANAVLQLAEGLAR